jgi:hypothetical protein
MRKWLARFRHAVPTHQGTTRSEILVTAHPPDTQGPALLELAARVSALEQSETLRAAEHTAMLDRLQRLYKRHAQRIVREAEDSPDTTTHEESVMHMRKRLGR